MRCKQLLVVTLVILTSLSTACKKESAKDIEVSTTQLTTESTQLTETSVPTTKDNNDSDVPLDSPEDTVIKDDIPENNETSLDGESIEVKETGVVIDEEKIRTTMLSYLDIGAPDAISDKLKGFYTADFLVQVAKNALYPELNTKANSERANIPIINESYIDIFAQGNTVVTFSLLNGIPYVVYSYTVVGADGIVYLSGEDDFSMGMCELNLDTEFPFQKYILTVSNGELASEGAIVYPNLISSTPDYLDSTYHALMEMLFSVETEQDLIDLAPALEQFGSPSIDDENITFADFLEYRYDSNKKYDLPAYAASIACRHEKSPSEKDVYKEPEVESDVVVDYKLINDYILKAQSNGEIEPFYKLVMGKWGFYRSDLPKDVNMSTAWEQYLLTDVQPLVDISSINMDFTLGELQINNNSISSHFSTKECEDVGVIEVFSDAQGYKIIIN